MIIGIYIVGAILIAFGIAVLSRIGSLTSSQIVYDPTVGTILFIIGAALCYAEYTSNKSGSAILCPNHQTPTKKDRSRND